MTIMASFKYAHPAYVLVAIAFILLASTPTVAQQWPLDGVKKCIGAKSDCEYPYNASCVIVSYDGTTYVPKGCSNNKKTHLCTEANTPDDLKDLYAESPSKIPQKVCFCFKEECNTGTGDTSDKSNWEDELLTTPTVDVCRLKDGSDSKCQWPNNYACVSIVKGTGTNLKHHEATPAGCWGRFEEGCRKVILQDKDFLIKGTKGATKEDLDKDADSLCFCRFNNCNAKAEYTSFAGRVSPVVEGLVAGVAAAGISFFRMWN